MTAGLVAPGARLVDAAGGPGGTVLGGDELHAAIAANAELLRDLPPGVLFARMSTDVPSVLRYLGALAAGRAVALLDTSQDRDVLVDLVTRFRPAAVLGTDTPPPDDHRTADLGGPAWLRRSADGLTPHPDLAVLLSTSGSTGSPKFVKLSADAIHSNADAIATVLGIDAHEVAPTSLPLHYSYGMSVLNSHLLRGATVVVEDSGVLGRPFWQAVGTYGITSLAGVPYHYQMLRRLRFDPARYPTLRTITQAGGKLAVDLIAEFNTTMTAVGGRMFVMYGQTEAGPRMATVPAERLAAKLGSVGPALPGGKFAIRADDGTETDTPGSTGEVIYRGPNVMMGYARSEADLATGDECGGELATGDLGHLDDDGYLHVTGRLKRIGKVFGNRVSLDDLEQIVRSVGLDIGVVGAVGAVPAGDAVVVHVEGADADTCRAVARALAERLHLHASGFDVRGIPALPLLPSGKIDYRALEAG